MIAFARFVAVFLLSAAVACAAGVLGAAGLPFAAGDRSFTVMSGSMSPTIHTGDIVVDTRIRPAEARVGDIVTFNDPDNPSRLITHRLRSVRFSGTNALMVTKGDANNTVERWTVPVTGRIGRVAYRLPALGYALSYSRAPIARLFLIVIPLVLLGAFEVYRIWRPRRREPTAETAVLAE